MRLRGIVGLTAAAAIFSACGSGPTETQRSTAPVMLNEEVLDFDGAITADSSGTARADGGHGYGSGN